ncbi:MAG: sulfite exporter TauE/SafE family protein [Chloroflexota bacterium]|nr:sulfite exporter TauE/SafE family protein [Chloroflexota bacterium]
MDLLAAEIGLGFVIGLTLGLLGGGGSILTVPALVYLVGQPHAAAVTASLVIVGANSAMGAFMHRTHNTLNWRVALVFGGTGMVMSYLAAGISKDISPALLMVLFALLMLLIGTVMLTQKSKPERSGDTRGLPAVIAGGAVVGMLTGVLGVGGGFLIVPALVMLIGLPMREAVSTSLIIIAMNSLAGFLGHLGTDSIDIALIVIFTAAGIAGTFMGVRLAQRVRPERLKRSFGVFVIGLALVLLLDNLSKLI